MNVEYKEPKETYHPSIIPWSLYEKSFHRKANIVTQEVPEEIAAHMKEFIADFHDEYDSWNTNGAKTNLDKLNNLISGFIPLPKLDFIVEDKLIEKCLCILDRNINSGACLSVVQFLNYLTNSSPEYMNCFSNEIFKKNVEIRLNSPNLTILYLLNICNIILEGESDNVLIFEDFDMSLLPPFIKLINSNYGSMNEENSEDSKRIYIQNPQILELLNSLNIQVYRFISNMSEHPMDEERWNICFECVLERIKISYLAKINSIILMNLIQSITNENDEEYLKRRYEMLTHPDIMEFVQNFFFVERKNLFIYYINFIFKFNEDPNFFSISVSDIISYYFQLIRNEASDSVLDNVDDHRFMYVINNLLIIDYLLVQNSDVIEFTQFLFNEKIPDFDFPTKASAVRFFCCFIAINADIFFSNVVDYSNFLEFFDDFVPMLDLDLNSDEFHFDDLNDLDLIKNMIACMNEINKYFTLKCPDELEHLMRSDCTDILQQFVMRFESYINNEDNTKLLAPVMIEFMQLFPLQTE